MKQITLQAPAKVNLFLEVTGKLPNGYHELATLFAKVSLADILHIQAEISEKEKITFRMSGPFSARLTTTDDNLVIRAVRAFEDYFHMPLQIDIALEKNIPTGAGLGGGSSDAGTVLRALCQLFDRNPFELLSTATRLGADVPLFLYPDTFLKGEGIGEKLTPIPAKGPFPWAILVYPDTAVPTKGVFARLQLPPREKILTTLSNLDILIRYVKEGLPFTHWQTLFFNRLEEAVLPYVYSVRDVKQDLSALGLNPLMSGSGSTVFALTTDRKRAEDLAGKINKQGRKVFVVQFGGITDEHNRNSDPLNGRRAPQGFC